MNILLINHYAGSDHYGMEFRPYLMAREWVKMGHDVTILAATFTHLRKVNPAVSKDFEEEYIDGIRYVWVKACKYQSNGLMRVVNMMTFYNKLKWNAKKIADKYKPDSAIASSTYPFDIFAVSKIAKHANAKLCFEIHDLWPLSPIELFGFKESNPLIKYLQRAEDFAFQNAETVISILPDANIHMKERGFSDEKYVYVPNGVVLDVEAPAYVEETVIEDIRVLKEAGNFLVAYAGNHSGANGLEAFIEAAASIDDPKIKLLLIGGGNDKPKLVEYAKTLKADNVLFYNPVKKDNIPYLLEIIDIAFMGLKRESLFRFGISPNKLFDYMLAKKPILYAVEASNNPIKEASCGITAEAENAGSIAKSVVEFSLLPRETLLEMGENAYRYVVTNHDYRVLSERFVNAIKR